MHNNKSAKIDIQMAKNSQVAIFYIGSYGSKKAPIFIEIFRIISMFQKKCLL